MERRELLRAEKRSYDISKDYQSSVPIVLAVFLDHMEDTLRQLIVGGADWKDAEDRCDFNVLAYHSSKNNLRSSSGERIWIALEE